MGQAAAIWATVPGTRRTSPTDTLSIDVATYTSVDPAGEKGIDRVEFSVVVNGGAPTVHTVSAPTIRVPNYSGYTAPHPNIRSGMVPTPLYGITLACSASATGDQVVAAGKIEVTATVYSVLGTATALPGSIVLYNDSDGVDRRPSVSVRYVDESGNDSWDGTAPTFAGGSVGPKATIASALGTGECGGKTIHVSGAVGWFGTLGGTVFTSDHHWCRIVLAAGAVLRRSTTANTIFATSAGQRFRMCLEGPGELRGLYLDVQPGAGSNGMLWVDGVKRHSEFYTPERPCTIFYETSSEAQGGQNWFNLVGVSDDSAWQMFASCSSIIGLHKGLANMTLAHDCEVAYIMAEAIVSNNATGGMGHSSLNLWWHDQVAGTNAVRGWLSSLVHTGNLTISTAGLPAGQAKLSQTGPMYVAVFGTTDDTLNPVDIAWIADELIGKGGTWDLQMTGAANAGNNGHFPVLSVGYDGATPYVIIQNASAVAGVQNAGMLTTWYVSSGSPGNTVDPHGDFWHGDGNHVNGVVAHTRSENCWHSQNIFIPNTCTVNRMAFVNNALTNPYAAIADFNFAWTGTTTDVVLLGNTFDCQGTLAGTNTRLCVVDNVFRGAMSITAGTSPYIESNHFVTGTTYGSNVSTGPWFNANPIDQGWSYEPASGNLDTGSGRWFRPEERRWDGATADSRGVDRVPGLPDWNVLPAGSGGDPGTPPVYVQTPPVVLFGAFLVGLGENITPSDSAVLEPRPSGLYIGTAGDLTVVVPGGATLLLKVFGGQVMPLRVEQVKATGTTATNIRALL